MKKTINSKLIKAVLILSTLFMYLPSYSLFSDSKQNSFVVNIGVLEEIGEFISCKRINTGEACEVDIYEIIGPWPVNQKDAYEYRINVLGNNANNPWEVTIDFRALDSPFVSNGEIFVGSWNANIVSNCANRSFTATSIQYSPGQIENGFSFHTYNSLQSNASGFHSSAQCPAVND